jgi:ribose transport system permease protein
MSTTDVAERAGAEGTPGGTGKPPTPRTRGSWAEKAALPLAWVVLFIVFAALNPDRFLSMGNVSNILGSQSILFMLALAALLPSMVGDIDLSLGSIGGLSAILVAVLNVQQGMSIGLACLVAIAAGALCGAANALFVVRFRTEPFIMTLGTGVAVLFLATGVAGLQLLGAQDYAQQLFYGGALVAAVTLSRYLRRT